MGTEATPLYRGSVKNIVGPVQVPRASVLNAGSGSAGAGNTQASNAETANTEAVVFDYTDAFSVFDWGKMPDHLAHKGEALAVLAAHFFELLEKPENWKEFSRTPEALGLRKQNRFGSGFNVLGERLQVEGLRTHYLGLASSLESAGTPLRLSDVAAAMDSPVASAHTSRGTALGVPAVPKRLVVRRVHVVPPKLAQVLGRQVPDYTPTHAAPLPRLVPCEVVFRFGCPAGSSLIERVKRDPDYLAARGFASVGSDADALTQAQWDFPVLEMFTKLESVDRSLTLSEGLAVSGLAADRLQELLWLTAWVAAFLRAACAKVGLELADGKLEWGIDEKGQILLVDAIGPDELRLLKNGVSLSKEFLRDGYRGTSWYTAVQAAKAKAASLGVSDWKRAVTEPAPKLSESHREVAIQLYLSLTQHLTGRKWFPDAWNLDRVVERLKEISK